tara:strand:+ start:3503 stop:3760 length:258 start_codon:yes stop_codon:yes gene_type:complete
MSDELTLKAIRAYNGNLHNGMTASLEAVVAMVLEEAARVVALMPRTYDKIKQDHDVLGMKGTWTLTLNNGPAECAAAIRAMKGKP